MKTKIILISTLMLALLLALTPAHAQWIIAAPDIVTAAATPFVGFGTGFFGPQDRVHVHKQPGTPDAVIRLSQLSSTTCSATAQIMMEPTTGTYSAISTPGDLIIRTIDIAGAPETGECAEDIIMTTKTNLGWMRFATTPVYPGPDLERMVINPDGLVGIARPFPAATLHVGIGLVGATSGTDNARINIGTVEFLRDAGSNHLMLGATGSVTPSSDCNARSGSATLRWSEVFACNGMINTSDLRQKDKIQNLSYGLAEIMKLRPVSFVWKNKPEEGKKIGVIAQEVQQVLPEVVNDPATELHYDELGNLIPNDPNAPLGVYYSDIIPVLIKAIQEQQQKIAELESRLAASAENTATPAQYGDILLEQNNPNPFSESTSIMYFIPANVAGTVEIVVADAGGSKVLQRYPATVNTPQQVTISARGLDTGVYVYGVSVNGRIVQSKKMMIMK